MRKNITLSIKTEEEIKELQNIYSKRFQGSRVMQSWIIAQAIEQFYEKTKKEEEQNVQFMYSLVLGAIALRKYHIVYSNIFYWNKLYMVYTEFNVQLFFLPLTYAHIRAITILSSLYIARIC